VEFNNLDNPRVVAVIISHILHNKDIA